MNTHSISVQIFERNSIRDLQSGDSLSLSSSSLCLSLAVFIISVSFSRWFLCIRRSVRCLFCVLFRLWKSVYLNTAVISASRLILLRLPDDLLMFFRISDFKPAAWWKSHTCIWALCHNCWSFMMWFLLRRVSVTKPSSGFISPSLTPVFYLNNTAPPGSWSAVYLCVFVFIWCVSLYAKRPWALQRHYINNTYYYLSEATLIIFVVYFILFYYGFGRCLSQQQLICIQYTYYFTLLYFILFYYAFSRCFYLKQLRCTFFFFIPFLSLFF